MNDVPEFLKNVDWVKVDAQEDYDDEIPALRGDYKGEIKGFNFVEEYNFYGMNMQITETVKGIKGDNRYVSKTFNLGESEYQTVEEGQEKLIKALKTVGVTSTEEAIGKIVCMRIRPNTDKDGKVRKDKKGWPKHIVGLIKEFKGATDDANVAQGDTKLPF